jgi:hypothetical protein
VELESGGIDFEGVVFSVFVENENQAGEGEEEDDEGRFPISHGSEIK